jgi:CRISPR-associated protein Cmr4
LYSLVLSSPIFNKDKGIFPKANGQEEEQRVMTFFEKGLPKVIQIGGNATIGKGIVRTNIYNGAQNSSKGGSENDGEE